MVRKSPHKASESVDRGFLDNSPWETLIDKSSHEAQLPAYYNVDLNVLAPEASKLFSPLKLRSALEARCIFLG